MVPSARANKRITYLWNRVHKTTKNDKEATMPGCKNRDNTDQEPCIGLCGCNVP